MLVDDADRPTGVAGLREQHVRGVDGCGAAPGAVLGSALDHCPLSGVIKRDHLAARVLRQSALEAAVDDHLSQIYTFVC